MGLLVIHVATAPYRGASFIRNSPPSEGRHRSLGTGLRKGPTGGGVLMSEVPLYSDSFHFTWGLICDLYLVWGLAPRWGPRRDGTLISVTVLNSFRLQVPGFKFQVSGFKFQVSGFGLQVSGFRFQVSGLKFQVSGFGFLSSGFKFQVSGFGFQASGFRFQVSGFRFGHLALSVSS